MLWHTNIQLPNQLEMPQRILNILHLLLWTPLYLWILFLRLIVILAYVQTTHPLHLCNIRSMHIHTILILHIFLNLLISSLLLWCIIPLFFKLHHNLLHIISRQQYHRLNGTFVVPTKFLCFLVSKIHRKTELYVLQESAIWLLLLVNVHLFYKAVKEFFLLQVGELII